MLFQGGSPKAISIVGRARGVARVRDRASRRLNGSQLFAINMAVGDLFGDTPAHQTAHSMEKSSLDLRLTCALT